MATNIQIVKLTTGEDLIGDIKEEEIEGRGFLLIKKPAIIMIMPKPGSETDYTVGLLFALLINLLILPPPPVLVLVFASSVCPRSQSDRRSQWAAAAPPPLRIRRRC